MACSYIRVATWLLDGRLGKEFKAVSTLLISC